IPVCRQRLELASACRPRRRSCHVWVRVQQRSDVSEHTLHQPAIGGSDPILRLICRPFGGWCRLSTAARFALGWRLWCRACWRLEIITSFQHRKNTSIVFTGNRAKLAREPVVIFLGEKVVIVV